MKRHLFVGLTFVFPFFLLCSAILCAEAAEEKTKTRFQFSDLTVLDKETGLMWTRDANIRGKGMTRADAFKFVEQLNKKKYAGFSDWRLPQKEELETLVNYAKAKGVKERINELLNEMGFKNVLPGYYWSSTINASNATSGWIVQFWVGYVGIDHESSGDYVWAVRSGQ